MPQTIAIVQARLGSHRLKSKVARRLGGLSLLEWVVRRVSESHLLSGIVIATGDGLEDRAIRDLAPSNVPVFTGSERDVLGRFAGVVRSLQPDAILRVCADNPFIDPSLIDRLVQTGNEHSGCDYISYCSREGKPAILSSVGLYAEWVRSEALLTADVEAEAADDREHVTRYIYSRPDRFQLRFLPAPESLDRDDLRLTVDFEQDWEHAQTIFEALGPERLDWQSIARLLECQPALRSTMAEMNRAHAKA